MAGLDDTHARARGAGAGRGAAARQHPRHGRKEVDARVIEVEFEEENGKYIYEFELITPDGRLLEAIADAVTGEILSVGEDVERLMRALAVEDDPRILRDSRPRSTGAGFRVETCRRRRGGLVPRRHRGLRPHRARPRPAADGRPRGAQALARRRPRDAGPGADRPRRLDRAGRGHRRRRRRLPAKALPHGGARRPRPQPRPPRRRPRRRRRRRSARSPSTPTG